mgnify:CR=1 FL=1
MRESPHVPSWGLKWAATARLGTMESNIFNTFVGLAAANSEFAALGSFTSIIRKVQVANCTINFFSRKK